jgi:AcrR family transcriptional regulator
MVESMTTESLSEPPHRRPKGDKRARTRAKLIQTAAQLAEETGYDGVTMQAVARRAGMSNGAIYGNFKSREDLLAAIGPTYWPQIRPRVSPGAGVDEVLRAIAEALIAVMPARARAAPGRLRGMAYGLTNEGLRVRTSERANKLFAVSTTWWRARFPDERQLPMPAEDLVRVISALSEGLTFQRLATPELISDAVIYAAFEALAGERRKPPL